MTKKQRNSIQNPSGSCSEEHGEEKRYWVLKGAVGHFYTCAHFGDVRYTALCVFDSREAAVEHVESLDENQMFMSTLELYGSSMPACVRQGPLLPKLREVSARELWKIIETISVGYVTMNPPSAEPSAERKVKTFELQPVGLFKGASSRPRRETRRTQDRAVRAAKETIEGG